MAVKFCQYFPFAANKKSYRKLFFVCPQGPTDIPLSPHLHQLPHGLPDLFFCQGGVAQEDGGISCLFHGTDAVFGQGIDPDVFGGCPANQFFLCQTVVEFQQRPIGERLKSLYLNAF